MPFDPNSGAARLRRGRWQWRLRTLLVLLTVLAVALAGWRAWLTSLRDEAAVIARLSRLGAGVQVVNVGPPWLQKLPGFRYHQALAVNLDLAHRSLSDNDLASLFKLPRLRELRFKDTIDQATLARLHTLPDLATLWLAGTDITGADLHLLRDMPQLKSVTLGKQVTIRAMEELADARPDMSCGFAESLYNQGFVDARLLEPEVVVYDFEVAARWKLACARFKPDPHKAELAALEQLAGNYERLLRQATGSARFTAVVRCALSSARMKLLTLEGDESGAQVEAEQATLAANEVREHSWRAYEADFELVRGVLHALDVAYQAERLAAEIQGESAAKLAALQTYVRELHRLRARVGDRYIQFMRGGEADRHSCVELACALADADLIATQSEEQRYAILDRARQPAEWLPQSLLACWGDQFLNGPEFFQSHDLLRRFEEQTALAKGDQAEARMARERWSAFLAEWCGRLQRFPEGDFRNPQATLISICLCATDCIERDGQAFFDSTLGDFDKYMNTRRPLDDEVDIVTLPPAPVDVPQ